MEPVSLDTHLEIDPEGHAVVNVEGDIDLATSPSFQQALQKALERSPSIVLDMSGVRFIDSSGLSVLVWGHREAEQAGGRLRIRRPSPILRRLLDITALDSVLLLDGETPSSATQN